MQEQIDHLKESVARHTSIVSGILALITGLANKLREAADDPDEVQSLADEIDAQSDSLAAAIVLNTPSADEPPAETGAGDDGAAGAGEGTGDGTGGAGTGDGTGDAGTGTGDGGDTGTSDGTAQGDDGGNEPL